MFLWRTVENYPVSSNTPVICSSGHALHVEVVIRETHYDDDFIHQTGFIRSVSESNLF